MISIIFSIIILLITLSICLNSRNEDFKRVSFDDNTKIYKYENMTNLNNNEQIITTPKGCYKCIEYECKNTYDNNYDIDSKILLDPLTPPFKRNPYLEYNNLVKIYTRGKPTSYSKMGILINKELNLDNEYKILTLMSRQRYRNSYIYDYYALPLDKNKMIKFFIKETKELYDDDEIFIEELGMTYKVRLDKNEII